MAGKRASVPYLYPFALLQGPLHRHRHKGIHTDTDTDTDTNIDPDTDTDIH